MNRKTNRQVSHQISKEAKEEPGYHAHAPKDGQEESGIIPREPFVDCHGREVGAEVSRRHDAEGKGHQHNQKSGIPEQSEVKQREHFGQEVAFLSCRQMTVSST